MITYDFLNILKCNQRLAFLSLIKLDLMLKQKNKQDYTLNDMNTEILEKLCEKAALCCSSISYQEAKVKLPNILLYRTLQNLCLVYTDWLAFQQLQQRKTYQTHKLLIRIQKRKMY